VNWTRLSFERLKGRFGSAPFSAREAFVALNGELGYSRNAVYQVLHELAENRLLVRLGRGIYMTAETRVEGWAGLSVEAAVEVASEPLRRAVDVLRGSGVEFMVTGPSVLTRFHHHLPRRLIHLVYVVDGAGEFAVTSLRGANLRALLNPGRREVDLALEAFRDGDIFLVREFARLEGRRLLLTLTLRRQGVEYRIRRLRLGALLRESSGREKLTLRVCLSLRAAAG
jgi:hypothetical protein